MGGEGKKGLRYSREDRNGGVIWGYAFDFIAFDFIAFCLNSVNGMGRTGRTGRILF